MSQDKRERYEHITIDCVACGKGNELTFSKSSKHEKVSCSHCGARLGQLSDFMSVADKLRSHIGG